MSCWEGTTGVGELLGDWRERGTGVLVRESGSSEEETSGEEEERGDVEGEEEEECCED